MTISVTMRQTRRGEDGQMWQAGQTYPASDGFAAMLISSNLATGTLPKPPSTVQVKVDSSGNTFAVGPSGDAIGVGAPILITGVPAVGSTLAAAIAAGWQNAGGNWTRNGANIAGATALTYPVVVADDDKDLTYKSSNIPFIPPAVRIGAAAPVVVPPGAPTIGVATGGDGVVNVVFTPPGSTGGSPILEYQAELSNANTAYGAGSPIAVTSANGAAVTGRVRARNSVDWGPWSANSNSVTPSAGATVPGQPAAPTATAGDGTVSLAFSAPSTGGSPILEYGALLSNGNTNTGNPTGSPVPVASANGSAVTGQIRARNAIGWGPYSPASNSVTPQAAASGLLKNAAKVTSMITAIKASGTQRTHIAAHGHSVVAGAGSNGANTVTAADALAWRSSSMFSLVGSKLNLGAFSAGMEGLGGGHEALFSVAGGAAKAAAFNLAGVAGKVITLSASGQSTSFVARGAAVRVYGYASAAGVVGRYQINGGTVTDATPAGSTGTGVSGTVWYEYVISGLTSGDTVTLLGPTTGTTRVSMVDLNYLTTPGLSMHRLSDPGQMGVQVVAAYLDSTDTQPTTPNNNWVAAGQQATMKPSQMLSITNRIGASGVAGAFNMFDVNDIKAFNYAGQAWGWTLADVKRHFQNYVTYMAGLGLPVIVVFGPLRDPAASDTSGTPYTQADIIQAYKEVSDASTNCAYIDLTERWTGANLAARYAQQQASGLIFDSVHPNAAGAEAFATDIANAILAA